MAAYMVKRYCRNSNNYSDFNNNFFLMYLVPGGPFLVGEAASAQTMAVFEKKYGWINPASPHVTT